MKFAIDIRPLSDPHLTGVGFTLLETLKELIPLAKEHHFYLFASGSEKTLARLPRLHFPNATLVTKTFSNRLLFALSSIPGQNRLDTFLPEPVDAWWFPNWTAVSTEKPYLLTVHDASFLHFPDFFHWKEKVLRALAKPHVLGAHAAHLLVVSPTTARDIHRTWQILPERMTVTRLGVDHELFHPRQHPSDRSFRAMYDLNRPYFLALATHEPRKNVPGIIEGYALYRKHSEQPIPLVLVGAASWRKHDIDETIKRTGYADDILRIGYIPAKHRPAILRGARALLFPSFFEGFGLPALEALACGVPVVGTNATSVQDLFGSAILSIDAHNSEDVGRALHALSTHADAEILRSSMQMHGLQIAQHFTWKRAAQDVLAALQKTVV